MPGLLLVDKPVGWTSFDVVNYVRKIVATAEGRKPKSVKVGHTGTLDPFATGLLVILIGKEYTRRADEFSKLDKTYEVTMRLGSSSTTGDPEGEITKVSEVEPNLEQVKKAAEKFVGVIQQTPPAYSAIKVNGQRAYDLARKGQAVKLEPRQVTIKKLGITQYKYPEVEFVADVSSGTYIRSLVKDIGNTLKTGAYTVSLNRTRVGAFNLAEAIAVKSLTPEIIGHHIYLQ